MLGAAEQKNALAGYCATALRLPEHPLIKLAGSMSMFARVLLDHSVTAGQPITANKVELSQCLYIL